MIQKGNFSVFYVCTVLVNLVYPQVDAGSRSIPESRQGSLNSPIRRNFALFLFTGVSHLERKPQKIILIKIWAP